MTGLNWKFAFPMLISAKGNGLPVSAERICPEIIGRGGTKLKLVLAVFSVETVIVVVLGKKTPPIIEGVNWYVPVVTLFKEKLPSRAVVVEATSVPWLLITRIGIPTNVPVRVATVEGSVTIPLTLPVSCAPNLCGDSIAIPSSAIRRQRLCEKNAC
jgi:hypothetical protein